MPQLNMSSLRELLADHRPPCASLYQPVHRAKPPAEEDPVRFANLIKQMEHSLARRYPTRQRRELINRLRAVGDDDAFWQGGDRDAVALFVSPDYFQVLMLPHPVEPLAIAADSFHVKPLIRILQSSDRYQILCLTQNEVTMYEGSRDRLNAIELRGVPRSVRDVPGLRLTQNVSSTTDLYQAQFQDDEIPGQTTAAASHLEHFLRAVDKAVWENHSRESRLPLILAAVQRYHPIFRRISQNQFLLDEGIELDPKRLSVARLRDEAWKLFEPYHQRRLNLLKDQFLAARAHRRGTENLFQAAEAAAQGRVGTLLIESQRHIPGRVLRQTGTILQGEMSDPTVDDALDDLAEMVLRTDGQVMIVPAEQMPTDQGLAAIYRY